MHARDEDDDSDVLTANDVEENLASYEVVFRKVLWILLKSTFDADAKKLVDEWLDVYGKSFADYYQYISDMVGIYLQSETLVKIKSLMLSIDQKVQMEEMEMVYLLQIEKHIYQFFTENRELYAVLCREMNSDESQLLGMVKELKSFCESAELGNLIVVETYFDNLDIDIKDILWEVLNAPFNESSKKMAADWVVDGQGKKFHEAALSFSASIKTFLQGKLVKYIDALNDTTFKHRDDSEEKILRFFADNYSFFEFIQTEIDKENSVFLQILTEYRRFLDIPLGMPTTSLRAEYDRKHPEKIAKEEKNSGRLRSLGLFATASGAGEIINVRSLSFENGLYHHAYYNCYHIRNVEALIESNAEFFEHFQESVLNEHKKIIFMNGSMRQSFLADEFCCMIPFAKGFLISESSFTALPRLINKAAQLTQKSCELDNYLLADSFGDHENGAMYREGMRKIINNNYKSKLLAEVCVNDTSKVILLYAQMQKIASLYAQDRIQFDFYSTNIIELQTLLFFFINHREMKPHNVILNLCLYHPKSYANNEEPYFGKPVELKFQIDSTPEGVIDFAYKENLKIMLTCCDLPAKEEKPLSPTDDKSMPRSPKHKFSSKNTKMPASHSLSVAQSFNMATFKQKRVVKELSASSHAYGAKT